MSASYSKVMISACSLLPVVRGVWIHCSESKAAWREISMVKSQSSTAVKPRSFPWARNNQMAVRMASRKSYPNDRNDGVAAYLRNNPQEMFHQGM